VAQHRRREGRGDLRHRRLMQLAVKQPTGRPGVLGRSGGRFGAGWMGRQSQPSIITSAFPPIRVELGGYCVWFKLYRLGVCLDWPDWPLFSGSAWPRTAGSEKFSAVTRATPHGYADRRSRTAPANTHTAGEPLFFIVTGYPRQTNRYAHTGSHPPWWMLPPGMTEAKNRPIHPIGRRSCV